MTGGKELADKLRKDRGGGIPWLVILDEKGQELVTSDGPKGNIGCPATPDEIAWFLEMIGKTARHMTAADLADLRSALAAWGEKLNRR